MTNSSYGQPKWARFWFYYVAGIIVAIVSFIAVKILPVSSYIRDLIAIPGIGGLLIIIVQEIIQFRRDHEEHKRNLELKEKEQDFTLGIASKMAELTFQKHVDFSEKYLAEAYDKLKKIGAKGATGELLFDAGDLASIRRDYAPWLTEKIKSNLIPFEENLRKLGVSIQMLNIPGLMAPERAVFQERMQKAFAALLDTDGKEDTEGNIAKIIGILREILGTDEITQLRLYALKDAISKISKREK